jgi:hypothetical protein
MTPRRELLAFALTLGGLVVGFFGESLLGGKILSPADVLFVSASFREVKGADYEPANRLLIDPVLQFQPWIEFNRALIRRGRLPLWNDHAGCGAPHLANAQSAPFDPFQVIAYVGDVPSAYALMAASRLWFAGLGMFLLARAWGLGPWGRWFAGLTFPLTGFLVVWLLFPVTNAAVWAPWVFLTAERVLARPSPRRIGLLALTVGGLFLGGHIQTSAHVLLAVGLDLGYRLARGRDVRTLRHIASWGSGVALGLGIAAITILPLWFYLGKSPVWADREQERPDAWRLTKPRVLDSLCTVVPELFGSQRRGRPNLAKAVGVHNYNESTGGYAGFATLLWLAPAAWLVRRNDPRVRFLAGLAAVGFLGAFGFPPIVNVLRALPVMNVTDTRRLTLWVAFALPLLGGIGLDQLSIPWPRWVSAWWGSMGMALAATLALAAVSVPRAEPWLRARAELHYQRTAVDHAASKAKQQVDRTLSHVPLVLGITAAEVAALLGIAALARRGKISWNLARLGVLGLTLAELVHVGYGLNPALERGDDRPETALIARLRSTLGTNGRVLGLGQELLPNVAMRYGLLDARNYDSVELSRALDWLAPLYEHDGRGASSRRPVTWAGVVRAKERLREASVAAVVAATPPPAALGARVEPIGDVWIAWLDAEPLVTFDRPGLVSLAKFDEGRVTVQVQCERAGNLNVRQTFDPAWTAVVDGTGTVVVPDRGAFLSVPLGKGEHSVSLVYDPPEVRAACAASIGALALALVALAGRGARFGADFQDPGLARRLSPG